MHELSIAHALIGLTREHVPDLAQVRSVRVRVGPMQAIEPEAMRFAWDAATDGTPYQGARLVLDYLPWSLHCRSCGRHWEGPDWPVECACGSADVDPVGSDELTLLSIDVDDMIEPDAARRSHEPACRQGG